MTPTTEMRVGTVAILGSTLILGVSFVLVASCGGAATPGATGTAVPGEISFALEEEAFRAPPWPQEVTFDVVSADMDIDGDPDVLVNWHHRARLELFENVEGSFALRNPEGSDDSGLYDNPGIVDLYSRPGRMRTRIREAGTPGVYFWHDPDRRAVWHFHVIPDGERASVHLTANQPLTPHGLDPDTFRRSGELGLDIDLEEETSFRLKVELLATQLKVSASLPVYVGAQMQRVAAGEVSVWKEDPHGMAWVDVRGTPAPDLFITRGGLVGLLLPPLDPKVDRFYEHSGGELLYTDAREAIPWSYGRGRRVEWVDIDGDMVNELYVGNTDTPNSLLALGDDRRYRDVAADAHLDVLEGDAFTWFDVDGNGLDDLVYVDAEGFKVALNRGERQFDLRPGDEIGLTFPASSDPDRELQFDTLSLHVLDYDNDGRLDLWLIGHGAGLRHALYRAVEDGFTNVTSEVGLEELTGTRSLILADLDNDGYLDAIGTGETFWLLHNLDGHGFDVTQIGETWALPGWTRCVAADVDGEGRLDLVLMGDRRLLAKNSTSVTSEPLRVVVRAPQGDPVGTVVRAFYADNTVQAQRFGSADNTQYSQGLLPLHFGAPPGVRIERLVVRWPDGHTETRVVETSESIIELRR